MLSDSLTGCCSRIGFEEQVDAALAVPVGQGCHYARPLPEDDAYAFLVTNKAASTS